MMWNPGILQMDFAEIAAGRIAAVAVAAAAAAVAATRKESDKASLRIIKMRTACIRIICVICSGVKPTPAANNAVMLLLCREM